MKNEKVFNVEAWIDRAERRYRAAVKRGQVDAVTNYAIDLRAIKGLEATIDWCTARGLTVIFNGRRGGTYYSTTKRITISNLASPRQQLHNLLHECGHHLIGQKHKRTERFGMGYGAGSEKWHTGTQHHVIDILDEEFEAWARGWKLGKKLGSLSDSDRPAFDKRRVWCLTSYVRWATMNYTNPSTGQ